MTYEIIKRNFEKGLWNIVQIKMAVKKGIISKEQYQEITGETYE